MRISDWSSDVCSSDLAETRTELLRSGGRLCTPSTFTTGYRYAEMGYTAAFEPAMLPANARNTHIELADVPMELGRASCRESVFQYVSILLVAVSLTKIFSFLSFLFFFLSFFFF